jgi:adenylyltransferase/sulfurtransferase
MRFRELKLRRNPECPVCGDHPTVRELIDYEQFCGIPQQQEITMAESGVPEITVTELKAKLDAGDNLFVLDVREPHEYDIARLEGTTLIPLGQLPSRVNELNTADDIVVHCKSGMRSAKAVGFLQKAGFQKVKNLKGGILAWSDQIDPSVPKY